MSDRTEDEDRRDREASGGMSRREFLKAAGLGAAGVGAVAASPAAGFSIKTSNGFSYTHDSETLETVDDTFRVDEIQARDWGFVKVAKKASDIQPLIDELAAPRSDGTRGGTVKLLPKVYRPETTIWLKKGVKLEGAQASRAATPGGEETQATVISTENMTEEATYAHNADLPHQHLPVIANYRNKPFDILDFSKDVKSREIDENQPTEEELEYWGHGIGLENIIIDGSAKKRYKDWYFGVYDATLFERAHNIRLVNVETQGFDGYGGFFNACKNVRDLGGLWRGGATDHHCSALTVHSGYPPDPTIPTTGVFDVEVEGPPPTSHIETGRVQLVTGGWSQARINAVSRRFIESEQDYWDGKAPGTETYQGYLAFIHEGGELEVQGYDVSGVEGTRIGGVASDNQHGLFSRDIPDHLSLQNVRIENGGTGFEHRGTSKVTIADCRIEGCETGIATSSRIPRVDGLRILGTTNGIDLVADSPERFGTMNGIVFDCDTGLKGTSSKKVVLNHPDFTDCSTAVETSFDTLVIHNGTGI